MYNRKKTTMKINIRLEAFHFPIFTYFFTPFDLILHIVPLVEENNAMI